MTIDRDVLTLLIVVALGGFGTWLILPHSHGLAKAKAARAIGFLLVLAAAVALLRSSSAPGPLLTTLFFYIFALAAILGAVLTVASISPIHSALWFAVVVLATSGLFLEAGASFLAAATVIVYAGAIIVTFLFVVMLASVSGHALYDRSSRFPARVTLSGTLLLWTLLAAIHTASNVVPAPLAGGAPSASRLVVSTALASAPNRTDPAAAERVLAASLPARARLPLHDQAPLPGVPPRHTASLGGTLFTDHLITIQIAAVLLFIALVAGASIARPKPIVRPTDRRKTSAPAAAATPAHPTATR